MRIDAQLQVAEATARLVRIDLGGPREDVFRQDDSFWLDLSLSPRPQGARARFVDRWSAHRFRRVGSVLMVPPDEPLQFRSEGGFQSAIICELPRQAISRWLECDFEWSSERLEATLDVSDVNVRTLLLRLCREMRKPGFASEMLVEMIVAQLSLEVGRYCAAIDDRAISQGGLPAWRLRLIDERLEDVSVAPTLTELAKLCGLSARQLTRGFRASRGCSIGDYAAQNRFDFAKRQLKGGASVKEVARLLGFATPSSFIHAFQRQTGLTPGQYRQQAAPGS